MGACAVSGQTARCKFFAKSRGMAPRLLPANAGKWISSLRGNKLGYVGSSATPRIPSAPSKALML